VNELSLLYTFRENATQKRTLQRNYRKELALDMRLNRNTELLRKCADGHLANMLLLAAIGSLLRSLILAGERAPSGLRPSISAGM